MHKTYILLFFLFIISSMILLLYKVDTFYILIIKLRLIKLWGLILVGMAIGIASLLFQTITQNNILTPNIIGFDSLFILIKTILLFLFGTFGISQINQTYSFIIQLFIMIFFSTLLFTPLIKQLELIKLILAGIMFSTLFHSITLFLQKIMSPSEYLTLQSFTFADFNQLNTTLLFISTIIIFTLLLIIWRFRFILDVLMLGRDTAINLGVAYDLYTYLFLIIISILVSTATALVGPMSFFGLLTCAISNQITTKMHHSLRIITVILVSSIILILGQSIFEHIFNMESTLSVAIDGIGGTVFLIMIRKMYNKAI